MIPNEKSGEYFYQDSHWKKDSLTNELSSIRYLQNIPGVQHNYSYFPIYVDAATYGRTRDELNFHLKEHGILARRYFYPVIPDFATYANSLSAKAANIPNARTLAESVISLPIHGEIGNNKSVQIIQSILYFFST